MDISGLADDRTRVLKHADTFAVLNHYGGIQPGGLGEEGLYHEGTRFLSRLSMDLEGKGLFFLGPSPRGVNGRLAVALTNPDQMDGDEVRGMKRTSRGVDLAPEVFRDGVTLSYRGLDGVVRRTSLQFTPMPSHLNSSGAGISFILPSQGETEILMTVAC